ncbi:hypothetical protein B0A48_13134 [Cryoendolithus antarcticus]|uniref:Chitin-binding type-1 domain-containing protein n=1 Tax=Cryoendolithus antarcticus TaxID=1507870 RepID=A0A1V8SNJ6_9PEZI|nr:hypothetical protein B0A48_13134 [Cryoendolithus antarcticus]
MHLLRWSSLLPILTSANIIFKWVQPTCNNTLELTGCLRGQTCLENGSCEPDWGPKTIRADAPPRSDGRCGRDFGTAPCDVNGEYGPCCSSMGWCGKTDDHCLAKNGCQSGCIDTAPPPPTTTSPPAQSQSEPVVVPISTSGVGPAGPATTDGSCGAANGGTVCGSWHLGGCCSMYGFCGNTAAHCGEGCQSGPCSAAPVGVAPGPIAAPMNANPGTFDIVGQSGVPAMHTALMPNGRVVFLDKVEDYTQLKLDNGQFAYSSEYDPVTNQVVPLAYKTNAFCAGGTFLADGRLLSVGGNANLSWLDPTIADGWRGERYLTRSSPDQNGQAWSEPGNQLDTARWYPTLQTLPDGRIFVASGSLNGLDPTVKPNNNPTYEILDRNGITSGGSTTLPLLVKAQPYYMYPFIHLLPTSDLFIFASKSSVLFSPSSGATTKTLPDLPGDYKTYPNTGGSALLPLSSANNWTPSIIICGGGAYQDITSPTDPSCGRISPLDANPTWEMDAMPQGRGMVEPVLLPDGTVLWLNGANRGAQGFGLAADPTFETLIYDPEAKLGSRWTRGAASEVPRLYHSVALLLLDGLRSTLLSPSPDLAPSGQQKIALSTPTLAFDATFSIFFTSPPAGTKLQISLYHGGFVTHSLHMGARMAFLNFEGWMPGKEEQSVSVKLPGRREVTPPGPYVVYVVVDGVWGEGVFVMVD